jgi:putative pyruvate formate lyase activating enzyme
MLHAPSYQFLSPADWDDRIREADRLAGACALCPRKCGVNRLAGEKGFCKAPNNLIISSIFPHHGEEPPISGTKGSGTVFFSYCTLKCLFCQNYQISHEAEGRGYSESELALQCMNLQEQGCHNINLVTAAHFLPWLLRALKAAAGLGLSIPIVYNNGGYEAPEAIDILNGIVDIYLPDMKYGRTEDARMYSHAKDYVEVNQKAVKAMFRQVGHIRTDESGVAYRGLCIRHLVLPSGRAGSENIVEFLLDSFDPQDLTISLMAQYTPMYRAAEFPEIGRILRTDEYDHVKRMFEQAGIAGFYQELPQLNDRFCIDFKKRKSEPLTDS